MKIEVLGFAGCPNFPSAVQRARAAMQRIGVNADIDAIDIQGDEAAHRAYFLGSPSVRVNGLDVECAARTLVDFGFGCRTYFVNGERQGLPPQTWIEAAIREAIQNENI